MNQLVDKSVLGHLHRPQVREPFRQRLDAGTLAMSTVTLLEQRVSDRSPDDSRRFDRLILSKMDLVPTEAADMDRAREVQAQLLAKGQHRGPSIPDLLVAAVAERCNMTVLHLDRDFEVIATITDQPEQRLADLPESHLSPARPARGTGIVQQLLETNDDGYAPEVICAGCSEPVNDVTDCNVHHHVATERGLDPLEGRLAFAHARCSDAPPVADYNMSAPMYEWLSSLCRNLGVPEVDDGVFRLGGPA